MKIKHLRYLFLSLFTLNLLSSCVNKQKQYFNESGTVFHTLYQIKYEAYDLLTQQIDAELQAFNLSLNPFNPNSIIAKINNNEATDTDEWFEEVFTKAMEVSVQTDGLFDITCAPLINLWGFGFSKKDSVTPNMIDSLKQFVGYEKVRLTNKQVVKDDPRLLLNCSAIAKGYACDVIARLLERNGVENYMIDIGGEVMMKGVNQNGNCWRIGINLPEDDTTGMKNAYDEIVQLCRKGGIATSGNYRNFYVKDGKKYAHTINPKTGYPAEQNVLSATIVADNCMTADAYATAFMTMGLEAGSHLIDSLPGVEYYAIYIDENGKHQIAYSEGMKPFLLKRQ